MHYCGNPNCGGQLMGQYAHCHHGCGWQNPYYQEMAYEQAVVREEILEEVIAFDMVEDMMDGDFF